MVKISNTKSLVKKYIEYGIISKNPLVNELIEDYKEFASNANADGKAPWSSILSDIDVQKHQVAPEYIINYIIILNKRK